MTEHGKQPGALMRWLSPVALVVLCAVTFAPVLHGEFLDWDDYETIAFNPSFHPPTFESIARYWSPANSHMSLYVPVTYTWWGAIASFANRDIVAPGASWLSPAPFHFANLALHCTSTILVLLICRRLVQNEFAALVGAAVFAVHPVQVEAIGWISGGKDLLSASLGLVAILMYLRFVQGSRGKVSYAIGIVAFCAAMLAKPQAVNLPLILLAMDYLLIGRSFRVVLKSLLPWFVISIPIIVIARQVQPGWAINSDPTFRPVVALDALSFYLGKLIWPAKLSIDYGRDPGWLAQAGDRYWTWIVPIVLLLVCMLLRRRWRWPLAVFAMFVAAMLPILGLLPFEFQTYSTVADHYLYPAMLAAALALGFGLSTLPWRRWIIPAAAMTATFSLLSYRQTQTWQSTRDLLEHTLEVNPASLAANDGLGRYWLAHDDMEQAIGFLANACRLHPNVARVHFDYGNALAKQGLLPAALDEYSQAVRIDRRESKYFLNAGNVLFQMGDLEQALRSFDQAAALDPNSAAPLENSGVVLERMGRFELARQRFASALRIDPTSRIAQDGLKRLDNK